MTWKSYIDYNENIVIFLALYLCIFLSYFADYAFLVTYGLLFFTDVVIVVLLNWELDQSKCF